MLRPPTSAIAPSATNSLLCMRKSSRPWLKSELDHAQKQVVSAITKGIENADLDIRLRGKREQLLIAGDTLAVIDQDAHAHAARGRLAQRLGDQPARFIAMEDVVLQVD